MSAYTPWLATILALEVISALTIFHPTWHGLALIASALGILWLTIKKPAVAASLLLTEYVIGSKGALLRLGGDGLGHGGIPLRIAWFMAFFLGWLIWAWQHKTYREWRSYLEGRTVYLVLAGVLVYAFFLGKIRGNPFVLADANGWGVWLLLLPAIDLVAHIREELYRHIPRALLVASAWMIIKTLALFYLFTHLTNPAIIEAIYLWVRRTGAGEVTRALPNANVWRVFFQSHVYVLPLVIGTCWYTMTHAKLTQRAWMLGIGAWATLVVSLSRSLLLGTAAGLFVSLTLFLFHKNDANEEEKRSPHLCTVAIRLTAIVIGALALVGAIFYAPPRLSGSLSDAILARVNLGEEAAVTRWKLLPALWEGVREHPVIGSGFGATITYESRDPRVVKSTGGTYTTYAFEWGWLEHWFKFGLIGIPLLLWILAHLGYGIWRSSYHVWIRGALVSSLIALAITHVFTPYINHPLGIMMFIVLEAGLYTPKKKA